MRRKPLNNKIEKATIAGFILVLLLAAGAYYYVWQSQSYGRTIEGTRALAEIWWKREQLQTQKPAQEEDFYSMSARAGCCVWLENPYWGSQIKINVPKGPGNCYEDPIVRRLVERDYAIVDITEGRCPRR
ncbi:hypothetical protein D6825_03125 [Candidatus Woesearchaeota archaeon]|nr:MAG: hypothetical protein D6825_03125 [Candidatus Woesearchaeota archaeon]